MLKCTKCGSEATHADAQIADNKQSCGVSYPQDESGEDGRFVEGEKHNWIDK